MDSLLYTKRTYYGLNVWKIIFSIVIICGHAFSFFKKGYIGVEFFFLTSGFLMYVSFKSKNQSTIKYFLNRLKTLYPDYIIAFIIICAIGISIGIFTFPPIANFIAEILMVQNIGIINGGMNYPAWYISVLITASPIVYWMLRIMKKKAYTITAIILVLSIFIPYIIICKRLEWWDNIYYIICPVWFRGFAELLLGTLLAKLSEKLDFKNRIFALIIEYITVLSVVALMFCEDPWMDFMGIVFCSVLIIICANKNSIANNLGQTKPIKALSKITYIIYLNQAFAIRFGAFVFASLKFNTALAVIAVIPSFIVAIYVLPWFIKFASIKLYKLIRKSIKVKN